MRACIRKREENSLLLASRQKMKKLREKKKSHADCQRSSCVESGLVVKNRRDIVDGLLLFLINNLGVYLRRLEVSR